MLADGTPLAEVTPLPVGDSPILGPEDAPVTVIVFTDLECPYCAMAHAEFEELLELRDDVRIVFKHTPLPFHENAVPASVAALAAGEQGRFWDFVDRAYANQDALSPDALLGHADALGLDLEAFKKSMNERRHLETIQADIDLAVRVGIQGTPTLFVNGTRLGKMVPAGEFADIVEGERAKIRRFVDAGVPEDEARWRVVALNYSAPEASAQEEDEEPNEPEIAYVPTDDRPAKGASQDDALVTLVAFSDFECPFCARANPMLETILENHPEVRLVYRHFPLTSIHPNAVPAAVAANVAHESGKFWELHDLLFEAHDELSLPRIKELAAQVGVDTEAIDARFTDDGIDAEKLIEDMRLGSELGVRGTPAFFVNGTPIFGAVPVEEMSALVNSELERAREVRERTSMTGDALYRAIVEAKQK